MSRKFVEVEGQRLSLSNLEKKLYPSCSFTKAHVLDYYRRIADRLIPHLRHRAVTLKRYPDGVEEEFFFEKHCPPHPEWVQTAEIVLKGQKRLTACLINDQATLLWVVNLAALELHVPLAGAASPETPDAMVFDLDPGEPAEVLACAQVALILRELLSRLGLKACVKSSGRKGLHVYVPLNSAGATFVDTKGFSRTVALMLQKNYPELVTERMAKEERRGKVFINWSQNDAQKTMICAYSLRGGEKPTVSFPLGWEELEQLARERKPEGFWVSPETALERVEKDGDLFHEILAMKQRLPHM